MGNSVCYPLWRGQARPITGFLDSRPWPAQAAVTEVSQGSLVLAGRSLLSPGRSRG